MGYIRHTALIVTNFGFEQSEDDLATVRDVLVERIRQIEDAGAQLVTPIIASIVNRTLSFAVMPDGSNEGWETSDVMDAAIERTIADIVNDDLRVSWCWVAVYDDDSIPTVIDAGYRTGDSEQPGKRWRAWQ